MTIEEMKARKIELGYSNEQIAELSGLPLGTVQKIFGGATKAPRYATLKALEKVLEKPQSIYKNTQPLDVFLREALPQYGEGRQGRYTVEDYYALPDNRRVELIDGCFYDLAAPSVAHQIIQLKLASRIDECIAAHECDCTVLMAPLDVQLDRDNNTMLQPDVMVFCGMEDVRRNKYYGAPDFVAEIISPSSRKKDMFTKLNKYSRAGVREYWLVDPKNKTVIVYDLEHDAPVERYSFTDLIPLGISEGRCEIDFNKIHQAAEKYYDLAEE